MAITDGIVTLRKPTKADASTVAETIQASLPELKPWMPWAVDDYDETHALEWMAAEEHGFVVIENATGEHLGSCGLNHLDTLNNSANLGYWIRSDKTGNGYATQVTKLAARHGHQELRLHRLEVTMSIHNERSRRVAEKAGAHYEGILRGCLLLREEYHDVHIWSLLPGDV